MLTFSEYKRKAHQYQLDGEILLLERKHAFLFYEPGKGKTYPAVSALQQVPNDKTLILSTSDSIRNMWEIDIVPQNILPKNTVLMSFTQAIQEHTKKQLLLVKWDVIIIDECHKVKSHNSQISKLVYQLTKRCPYVWGLTGTPRGNNDLDLYCQMHNLNVGEWGQVNYSMFVNTCCDIEKSWGRSGGYTRVLGINQKYKAGFERNVAMYSQRVHYEDDEMPPLHIDEVLLDYERTEQYKNAEEGIFIVDDNASTLAKLAAISKMHQAANGFLYYEEGGMKKTLRFQHNKKLDWLKLNINEMEPTVIVYRHTADYEDLIESFPNYTESISEFKTGKSNLLLLQCSRCESFNLQNCSKMYFYTMDYSFIKFKQMLHRVWRQGQEKQTDIKILLFNNTIETTIWNAVNTKKKLADLFMMAKGR